MTDCPYCERDLPATDTETARMDVLKNHVWSEHPDLVDEIVTGDISPGTYARVEAQFLTGRMEQLAEVTPNDA